MKKRILAILLSVIMITPVFATTGTASDDYTGATSSNATVIAEAAHGCYLSSMSARTLAVDNSSDYLSETVSYHAKNIADAVMNFESTYDFGENAVSKYDFGLIMSLVYNDNPKFFYLSNSYKYEYTSEEYLITKLYLTYDMEKESAKAALSEVDRWINEVVSLTDSSFSDLEYAIFFHDYLAENYEYDTSLKTHDLYNFIKTGKGVCQSYTYAYMALLEAVGIEASWASSNSMVHMWNVVKIDGEWYHVDLTWDDPVVNSVGVPQHNYFLLSDTAISTKTGAHYGWVSPYACSSDKYDDAALKKADSAYAYLNDSWYYISDGDLYKTTTLNEKGTLVLELDLKWNVWGSTTSVWNGSYSGLISYGGNLYLNSSTQLLQVKPDTGKVVPVYTYTENNGYIYGFRINTGDDGISGAGLHNDNAGIILHISITPVLDLDIFNKDIYLDLPAPQEVVAGDANGDNKVAIDDAIVVLKYIAAWDNISIDMSAADINKDGNVNINDVILTLKKIAGWKDIA